MVKTLPGFDFQRVVIGSKLDEAFHFFFSHSSTLGYSYKSQSHNEYTQECSVKLINQPLVNQPATDGCHLPLFLFHTIKYIFISC